MKKFLFITTTAIIASAYTLNLQTGWQLKGALADINVTQVFNNPNIKSVYTYDSIKHKWQAYFPGLNIDLNKFGVETLKIIPKGSGFWIYTTKPTTVNIPDNTLNNSNNSSINTENTITANNNLIITSDDFANKSIAFLSEDELYYFNSNGKISIYSNDPNYLGTSWSVNNNILITDKNEYDITNREGSLFDTSNGDILVVLNLTPNSKIISPEQYLNAFSNNTPLKNITNNDFINKTLEAESANGSIATIVFNSDGTFESNDIGNGTWDIYNNKILIIKTNDNTTYGAFINNYIIYITVNNNGVITDGGIEKITIE